LRLVAGGWFVLREKYCWLVADKPSEQGDSVTHGLDYPNLDSPGAYYAGAALSALDGVLVAVKDEMDCVPYPTTGGTRWLAAARRCEADAACVAQLRACGAILAGKANMHELGAGTSGINPHHRYVASCVPILQPCTCPPNTYYVCIRTHTPSDLLPAIKYLLLITRRRRRRRGQSSVTRSLRHAVTADGPMY
jgi:hypothetical protein